MLGLGAFIADTFIQSLLAIAFLNFAIMLHIKANPYVWPWMNVLETVALLATLLTQMGSLLYWHDNSNDFWVTVGITAFHACAFLCFIVAFVVLAVAEISQLEALSKMKSFLLTKSHPGENNFDSNENDQADNGNLHNGTQEPSTFSERISRNLAGLSLHSLRSRMSWSSTMANAGDAMRKPSVELTIQTPGGLEKGRNGNGNDGGDGEGTGSGISFFRTNSLFHYGQTKAKSVGNKQVEKRAKKSKSTERIVGDSQPSALKSKSSGKKRGEPGNSGERKSAKTKLGIKASTIGLVVEESPMSLHLPKGWTEHFSEEAGVPYYFNAELGITQWERP